LKEKRKKLLVRVFGSDKPGITSRLTSIISTHSLQILDLGQSVTQGLLSLSLLVSFDEQTSLEEVEKDLLLAAKNLDINIEYKSLDNSEELQKNYSQNFVISSVHPQRIRSTFLAKLTKLCASQNLNIISIENKSKKEKMTSLDLKLGTNDIFDYEALKKKIIELSLEFSTDIAILRDNVFRYNKRLIIFDMDSTLIKCEVIEELSKLAGSHAEVKKITDLAMNGKIDFTESLRRRVSTLKGVSLKDCKTITDKIVLNDGVEDFIQIVKSLGYKTGVISGGFTLFTEYFKEKLKLDYAFANQLEIDANDLLTGGLKGTIVDANQKAMLLDLIAQQESVSLEQVVAIGDGANDLPMLSKAGMGIAFHAKQIVKDQAGHQMSHGPMTSILSFLGIPEGYTPAG